MTRQYTWTNSDGLVVGGGRNIGDAISPLDERAIDDEIKGNVTPISSLASLQTLAQTNELNTLTTYVDLSTNTRYWAISANTFVTAGQQLDSSILNYVQSGFLPPASGTIASATLSSGVAYVDGNRVARAATPLSLTATRDNYIDVRRDGTILVTPVTVSATAPAIPANSMRLGFCTTNATNVTARSISAFDNIGNWMYNVTPTPLCKTTRTTATGYGGAAIVLPYPDADVFDNANIHDPVTNNSRFTLPFNGIYYIDCSLIWFSAVTPISAYSLAPRLDGSITDSSFPEGYQGTQATQNMRCSGTIVGRAGQYLEMVFTPNGASGAIDVTRFSITKVL